ncbi:two-component sensor histidine kinase [Carnobacterium sp. 17-4]|uniref:sensor histidine kinase n=1 Tax=Carnobacterium sp. (strain 17-4) TaxID=208596 RepID=UPI0002059175|nr:two-component sensor histidine kinase [Carnobacterium sp. 17-4]
MTIVLIILGFSFLQFARNTAYQNTETQLFGYAEALIDEDLQMDKLENGQVILKNQDVSIFVFDSTDSMIYPSTTEKYVSGISDQDLKKLKNGEPISLTQRNTDFFGNQINTAIVYQPFFTQSTGEFYGFIAVSAPISTIEANLKDIRNNLFSAFIFSIVGATIASYLFAKFQVKRINRIRSATHKVSKGDFNVHLENKEMDEFDDLAADFNSMVDSLKSSQEEIERQEKRRRQFMADAAHEMRTPLTTINGLLEGLEHDMIPENQKQRSIQLMQNETRRLIRLVTENLDYEKIRSNQITLQKQTFDAYEALEMIVEQLKGKASDSGDELVLDCPTELEIYADYDRFSQIIVNIIQNAIQFTTNGKISIIGYYGENESIIKIKDSGIGMTAEEVKNIWERYYKADISRKNTKYGESGLGLAIVQQLVNLHGASVEVESLQGEGTTFTLSFPFDLNEIV